MRGLISALKVTVLLLIKWYQTALNAPGNPYKMASLILGLVLFWKMITV